MRLAFLLLLAAACALRLPLSPQARTAVAASSAAPIAASSLRLAASSLLGRGREEPRNTAASCVGRLIVVRHGESLWNEENRFTGWADVPLTSRGAEQAVSAAELILAEPSFQADLVYTSQLSRSCDTADIILQRLCEAGQPAVPCLRRWRLNERHYGALTGLPKRSAVGKTIGGVQLDAASLRRYRSSLDGTPPPMDPFHEHYTRRGLLQPLGRSRLFPWPAGGAGRLALMTSRLNSRLTVRRRWRRMLWRAWLWASSRPHFQRARRGGRGGSRLAAIGSDAALPLPPLLHDDEPVSPLDVPLTECLRDACDRVEPFWREELRPALMAGKDVLLIGHANSLRALLRTIQELPTSDLPRLSLPNCVPLVYSFERGGRVRPAAASERLRGAVVPPIQGYFLGEVAAEFSGIDADADGAVRLSELQAAGYCDSSDECELLMDAADDNRDGSVDFKEYVMWADSQGGEAARQRARQISQRKGAAAAVA
jgi:2,3-bisphosphoglycerate-dependent phosphoglycerate mutase